MRGSWLNGRKENEKNNHIVDKLCARNHYFERAVNSYAVYSFDRVADGCNDRLYL